MQQKTVLKKRMRFDIIKYVFLLAFFLMSSHSLWSQGYVQQTGAANPFNGINADLVAHPTFGDLDGDGDQDLIVGQTNSNGILYYRNTGTTTAPVYTQATNPIPYSGENQYVAPDLGDLDGDGDLDAVIGNSEGVLFYFRNTGTPTAPVFTQQNGAENPFGGINFDDYLAPALGDLDGDGDLDLLVTAQLSGSNYAYYENIGTPTTPVYVQRTGSANPFNSSGAGGIPALGDIDRDGDLDLINGTLSGTFTVRLNIGTATAPLYVNRPDLLSGFHFTNGRFEDLPSPGLVDVDGDGDLDLVAGLFQGNLVYLENVLQITKQPTPASSTVCPGGSVSPSIQARGDGALTYQWYRNNRSTATSVPGQTSPKLSLSNVQSSDAGLYYVLVTGAGASIWSEPFSLTVSAPVLTVSDPDAVCAPATVDLTATVSADISGSTFAFFTDAAATHPLNNPTTVASGGTYYVQATSAAGCMSAIRPVKVTINPNPTPTITADGSTIFCPGGSVVLTSSEGASYLWSNGATTRSITVTKSGSYTVTVKTDAGCSATSKPTEVTVADNTNPEITACAPAQSASADANCSAQVPDFTANITATDNCTAINDLKITQSPSAGTSVSTGTTPVIITVTDASGNNVTCNTSFTVSDNTNPVIACPANITLSACQSTKTWSTPIATDNCSGVTVARTAGPASGSTFANGSITTITYTATDASNNKTSCSFTVTRAAAIGISISKTNATCSGQSNGSITVTASGGKAPYQYKINTCSSYQNGRTFGKLAPGNYTITVKDADNCTHSVCVTINSNVTISATITAGKILCNGSKTTLTTLVSGGKPSYQYKLINASNGATVVTYQSSKTFSVAAGTYKVIVKDCGGCEGISNILTVSQPSALNIVKTSQTNVKCKGGSDGKVTVSASGGKSPYKYKINTTSSYQASGTFSKLKAGSYTITVKDENDCSKSISITITQPSKGCTNAAEIYEITASRSAESKVADATNEPELDVNVSPNPSTSYFTVNIKGSNEKPVEIRVLDILGRNVYTTKGSANEAYRFGERFTGGTYVIQVIQGQQIKTVKVIKGN